MFILPVCKDAFIFLYSGSPTCERAAWRRSSIDGDHSLKTQFYLSPLNFRTPEVVSGAAFTPTPVCHNTVRYASALFLDSRSKLAPSRLKVLTSSHSCVPQAPVSTALTTVVLDQIQMFCLYFCKRFLCMLKRSFM